MKFNSRDAFTAGLGLLLGVISCLLVIAWPAGQKSASMTEVQGVVSANFGEPTKQKESHSTGNLSTDSSAPSSADAQLDADAVMERLSEEYDASGRAESEVRENDVPIEQQDPAAPTLVDDTDGGNSEKGFKRDLAVVDRRVIGVWARERNVVPEALEFREDGTYRFIVDMEATEGTYKLIQSEQGLRLTLSPREGKSLEIPVTLPHDDVLLCDPRGGTETGARRGDDVIDLRSSRYVFRRGAMAAVSAVRITSDRRRGEWDDWVKPESPDDLLIVSPPDSRRGVQISQPGNRFYLAIEPATLPQPDDRGIIRLSKGGDEELSCRRLDGRLLATSLDGRILATRPTKHSAEVWNLQDQRRIAVVRSSLNDITSIHLSESGQYLIVVAGDNLACCELLPPRLIAYRQFKSVEGVALSSDGMMLAAGVGDGRCQVWRMADLNQLVELTNENPDSPRMQRDHLQGVFAIDFSPDGTQLALGSDNGALRMWRTSDWTEQGTRDLGYPVQRVQFSPNGEQLYAAAVDGPQSKMTVWFVKQGLTNRTPTWEAGGIGVQVLSPILHGVAVEPSPDGRTAAVPVFHALRRGQDYLDLQLVNALSGKHQSNMKIGDDSGDPPSTTV